MGSITHALEAYGLIGVGLLIFLEDFGVPLPGETILIASAVTASQHKLNILLVALVAFLAAVAGDNVGWLIGHFGGRRLLFAVSCRMRVRGRYILAPSKVLKGERLFQHHGVWIIAVARFFDVLRQLNGIIAGALRTKWPVFLVFNIIGAALWVGVWSSIGYFVGTAGGSNRIDRMILYVFGGTVVLVVGGFLVRLLIRRLRHVPVVRLSIEEEESICREQRHEVTPAPR